MIYTGKLDQTKEATGSIVLGVISCQYQSIILHQLVMVRAKINFSKDAMHISIKKICQGYTIFTVIISLVEILQRRRQHSLHQYNQTFLLQSCFGLHI